MADPSRSERPFGSPGEPGARPSGDTQTFGDFQIVREIGRGGMGVVYEARQLSLDRPVALKVLHRGLGLAEATIARFLREAHAAARLHHPNIVPIYEQGNYQGNYYYAMELVDGESIDRLLAAEPPAPPGARIGQTTTGRHALSREGWTSPVRPRGWYEQLSRMLAEVADALHYAHVNGVVHRDVKPHNVILSSSDRMCITDFGLARLSEEPGMTLSGELLGSPLYMSPEQVSSGRSEVTARSDVYSLGATLYQILTGRPPLTALSREQVIAQILSQEPVAPRRLRPEIPVPLETICLKALSKNPRGRYGDAAAMAEDLRRYANGQPIRAKRPGYFSRLNTFVHRHPAGLAATAAVLALLIVAGLLSLSLRQSKRAVRDKALEVTRTQRTQEGQAFASRAEQLLQRGDYEQALAAAREALLRDETVTQAYEVMGKAYTALGQYEKAVWFAERVLPKNPLTAATFHLILAEAYRSKDPARADLHLRQLESLTPDSPDALYLQALSEPDFDEQMHLLGEVLRANPSHFRALEHRALQYFVAEDYERMKEDTLRLVTLRQKDGYAWALNGAAHLLLEDQAASTQSFNRALRLGADDPRIYHVRARANLRVQRYAEVIADVDRALELSRRLEPPSGAEAPGGPPVPGRTADRPRGAANDPQEAFSLDDLSRGMGSTLDPDLFLLRGEANFYLDRWTDCAVDCDRAIELGSVEPQVYALRAAARYRMNLPDLALRDVEEAIKLGASGPDLSRFRQMLLEALGRSSTP